MLPNNMTAKQSAVEQLIFSIPAIQRIAIERAVAEKSRLRTSMILTQTLVRHSKPKNADLIQAMLPLLRQDCLQAVAQNAAQNAG